VKFVEALEERGESPLTPATFDLEAERLVHLSRQRLPTSLEKGDKVFIERERNFAFGLGHALIVLRCD